MDNGSRSAGSVVLPLDDALGIAPVQGKDMDKGRIQSKCKANRKLNTPQIELKSWCLVLFTIIVQLHR